MTVTQAIPAEAPWEATVEEEVLKVADEPVDDLPTSDHLESDFQQHDTSAVGTPQIAHQTSSAYSAVGTPQMATPSTSSAYSMVGIPQTTNAPTTLITSAYAAITSCTTFHMEADPYKPITSCTTYHKENGGNNPGPTTSKPIPVTTSKNDYGAITSCTTFHMEADPYKPITSCTTYHKENNNVKPAVPTSSAYVQPPSNGAKLNEFCTSLYGNFTWCYSSPDTKADPNRFPSCNDVGCVLPATYQAQLFKPAAVQGVPPKDYAPWATGPQWVDKVYAAKANIIVATLWTTEWLTQDYPAYKLQAKIFNETASEFQGQSFYKINLDDKDVVSKLKDISIRRLPTYVFYRAGAELARLEGFQTKKALEDKMKTLN